jgi:hypothetical protein
VKRSVLCMAIVTLMFVSAAVAGEYSIRYPTETETTEAGMKVVQQYMDLIVRHYPDYTNTQSARVALLSKEWLHSKGIDPDLYQLNDFAFEEYRVLEVSDNYITVKGFNRSNSWARVIKFKIIVENGKYVIQPSHTSVVDGSPELMISSTKFLTVHWTQSELIK